MRELLEALAVKMDDKAKYLNPAYAEVYTDIAGMIREVVADDQKAEEEHNAMMDEAYNDARGSEKDW